VPEAFAKGRRALVTGGARGLGAEISLGLARLGASVLVADRDEAGGEATVRRIAAETGGSARFRKLDLSDLRQVRELAAALDAEGAALDILVNNAGLLPPMQRTTTRDGNELAFAVNYLGHFALTGLLLPVLRRGTHTRVVSASSIAHRGARIDFDDLQLERSYTSARAYAQSKLACLMFAFALQRRAETLSLGITSVAAHPGISRTSIGEHWNHEARSGIRDRFERLGNNLAMRFLSQDVAQGAQPALHAASSPDAVGGAFYGPSGFQQFRGAPKQVAASPRALDVAVQDELWAVSERLSGVSYADYGTSTQRVPR
jgi:NAD(P)-dependent dehydrogenase (short-subunit alcohol dehydrogenase family)